MNEYCKNNKLRQTERDLGPDFEAEAENTDDLINQLNEKFPQLKDLKLRIAVNQKIISENTALQNNDVAALMPPYSGG